MRREPPRQPKRLPPPLRKEGSFWIAVVLSALMLLAACGGAKNANNSSAAVPMRVVTDDLGRSVTIPVKVTRVVSLAPNLTENIFAVGAGDRLVGVTTYCNYPEQAKAIAKIGDTMTPNMESIIALKPDVVFVSTASQIEAFMKTLEANGIAVYVTNPSSLEDVYKSLIQLGDLLGTKDKAEALVLGLSGRVSRISHLVSFVEPRGELKVLPKVFIQISKEPLFTIGKDSFLTQVIKSAYGESVTAHVETAYPKISKETASALNPEVIILSESDDNKEPNDAFKNSPAVKNGRI
ncbi:MAG: helical backbone metal receptor, partial [Pyrinomonadaceae bacterium]